jgi:hypothetical protein
MQEGASWKSGGGAQATGGARAASASIRLALINHTHFNESVDT